MKPNAVFLFLILLSSLCNGQTKAGSPSKSFLGFYVSGNQSWLTVGDGNNPSAVYSRQPGFGYKAGCTFSREISSLFFIETSLGYVFERSQNSFQWISTDPYAVISYSDWRNSFSWVELPVVVNFTFWRKGTQSLFVGAGLSTRRLLTSSTEVSTKLGSGVMVASSVNDWVNEWNFFPIFQAGGHFSVSDQSRLTVMLSYQRSISRLFKTASPPTGAVSQIGDPDFTQNAITLSVAYSVNWSSLR